MRFLGLVEMWERGWLCRRLVETENMDLFSCYSRGETWEY